MKVNYGFYSFLYFFLYFPTLYVQSKVAIIKNQGFLITSKKKSLVPPKSLQGHESMRWCRLSLLKGVKSMGAPWLNTQQTEFKTSLLWIYQ